MALRKTPMIDLTNDDHEVIVLDYDGVYETPKPKKTIPPIKRTTFYINMEESPEWKQYLAAEKLAADNYQVVGLVGKFINEYTEDMAKTYENWVHYRNQDLLFLDLNTTETDEERLDRKFYLDYEWFKNQQAGQKWKCVCKRRTPY